MDGLMVWLTGAAVTVLMLALAGALGLFIFRVFVPKKLPPMVCATCGHAGPPKSVTRGSIAIEIVLWLLFILPGLLYSLWRLSTRHSACAECGGTTLVPPASPVGRRLVSQAQVPAQERVQA